MTFRTVPLSVVHLKTCPEGGAIQKRRRERQNPKSSSSDLGRHSGYESEAYTVPCDPRDFTLRMPKYINLHSESPDGTDPSSRVTVQNSTLMPHFKLTIAYDGTPYYGWQVQPNLPTVQGVLSDVIFRAIRERVLPQGSGRTDSGVHALAQVASFSLKAPIPPERLQLTLNRCLPPSIRIISTEVVSPTFHARHSAIGKTYEYRIFPLRQTEATQIPNKFAKSHSPVPDAICPPTLAPFVWPCPWPLNLDHLNRAARHVIGTHDFTSFAAADPDLTARGEPLHLIPTDASIALTQERAAAARTPVRTITQSEWTVADGLFLYRVTANGFLHHMVRNLVGAFVQAGSARIDPDSIPGLIAARNRSLCGPTAPASGLFLLSVEYSDNC